MDIFPRTCKAVTKKGAPCKRPPMKGSEFCYIHSFDRHQRIAWWKHPKFHATGVFVTILGVLITIILFHLGPTREHQQKIIEKQTTAEDLRKKEHDETMSKLSEIANSLEHKPKNPPVEKAKSEIEKELQTATEKKIEAFKKEAEKQEKQALLLYQMGIRSICIPLVTF